MGLDGQAPCRELQDIVVGKHEARAIHLARHHGACHAGTGLAVDHLALLGAQPLFDDRPAFALAQQRLEYHELVRIHVSLDHAFAEAPGTVDPYHVAEARLGIEREHDAGRAEIRAHHALYAHRERRVVVAVPACVAIGHDPVGEQRRVASLAGIDDGTLARDIEEGIELAGETRVGKILRGRARAHRDVGATERPVGFGYLARDRDRHVGFHDGIPDRRAGLRQAHLLGGEARKAAADQDIETGIAQEHAIGLHGDRETRRHGHTAIAEPADHFTKRRVLRSRSIDVGRRQIGERDREMRGRSGRIRVGLIGHDDLSDVCRAEYRRP